MIYLWRVPEKFLNCNIGTYNRNCSPDSYFLRTGRKLESQEFMPIPTVNFEVAKNKLSKFDCLPNSSLVPLVNNRIKAIFEQLAPGEAQFFPAKLICLDGQLEGYHFLNITQTIIGIDHEKSIYKKMKTDDVIIGFDYLTYIPDCMGNYHLARDEEYLQHILVSDVIKSFFEKERITGVWLVRPEDYFRPLSALI